MFEAVIDRLEVKKERKKRKRGTEESFISSVGLPSAPPRRDLHTPPRLECYVSTSKLKVWLLALEVYY